MVSYNKVQISYQIPIIFGAFWSSTGCTVCPSPFAHFVQLHLGQPLPRAGLNFLCGRALIIFLSTNVGARYSPLFLRSLVFQINFGARVAKWLVHSTIVEEVGGSNQIRRPSYSAIPSFFYSRRRKRAARRSADDFTLQCCWQVEDGHKHHIP